MFRENGVSNSVNDMYTMLNNFREKTQRGAAAPKWGRTSQRTTNTRPRDISNATGGTMTTRSGEPASKRESYTAYMEGRAAAVRELLRRGLSLGAATDDTHQRQTSGAYRMVDC